MATKLAIYNAALVEIGDYRLASLTESGERRRVLDETYDEVVEDCLAESSWNFATETVQADADTGIDPAFGYEHVFAKPSDWIRTHALSADEYFNQPLNEYYDDVNYWSADVTPIYIRYVSNDTGMGLELSRWPRSFTRYVELELAQRICERLTQSSSKRDKIEERRDKALRNAKNNDAMNEPTKFAPTGAWTRAREGGHSGRDRGNRGTLIG